MSWLTAANVPRHAAALLRAATLVGLLLVVLVGLAGCSAHMEAAPVDVKLFGWKLSSPQPTSPPGLSSPVTTTPASSPGSLSQTQSSRESQSSSDLVPLK